MFYVVKIRIILNNNKKSAKTDKTTDQKTNGNETHTRTPNGRNGEITCPSSFFSVFLSYSLFCDIFYFFIFFYFFCRIVWYVVFFVFLVFLAKKWLFL